LRLGSGLRLNTRSRGWRQLGRTRRQFALSAARCSTHWRDGSRHGASLDELAITKEGEIVVGKFVDRERPDYQQLMRGRLSSQLGERYLEADEPVCG